MEKSNETKPKKQTTKTKTTKEITSNNEEKTLEKQELNHLEVMKKKIAANKKLEEAEIENKQKVTTEVVKIYVNDKNVQDDEDSYVERIQIKTNSKSNQKAKVVDSEVSDTLLKLKQAPVANKPNETETSSEQEDMKILNDDIDLYKGVERYNVDISKGLTQEQVDERNAQGLTNANDDDKGKSYFEIVISNIFTFFNILYFIITAVLIWVGNYDQLVFLAVVIPNIGIGIAQEISSKKKIDKLKLMSAPVAIVIRDGQKLEIPVSEVVLDDIVMFTSGKQICADSIVLDGNMEVNESLLTGEADAIPKTKGSKLMAGSFVSSGTCLARIDKIGKDCFISKMSNEAKKYNVPKSELLKTLKQVIKIIAFLILPVAILYMLSHIAPGSLKAGFSWPIIKSNISVLRNGIAEIAYIILAMIPAGLFLLTSVALTAGVLRLAKNKCLVQQLYCIEMLARVDVLCLDKTGTITDGTMRVCDCVEIQNKTDYTVREIVGSMMNSFKETNLTSEALIRYFEKNNVLTAQEVIPFSSKRKFSAVTFVDEGTFIIGAPDFVIKNSYDKIQSKVTRFSNQGCRVLALGHVDGKINSDELPKNVLPVALIVIQDHIREDAPDTIAFFKQNGVNIKVISGDNPETVSKIADRVGVENADRFINLNGMTDDEVRDAVFNYTVFGRVSPSQKKLIVQTLKENGKTVAMTGDGVNDIPALKEADCSIAMASGSEATRYISHLVLMDSNFSSMPKVVNEGRRVINNIQKTSSLYLTKNLFAFLIAIMYIIVGFVSKNYPYESIIFSNIGFPFNPKCLFLIETIILGFATLCLSLQPNREIVKGKFINNVIKQILPGAITILLFQLMIFFAQGIKFNNEYAFLALSNGESVFTTMSAVVTTMIMLLVLYKACLPFNWFRKLVFSVVFIIVVLMLTIPVFQAFIKVNFSYFGITEWCMLIVLISLIAPVMKGVSNLLIAAHIVPSNENTLK